MIPGCCIISNDPAQGYAMSDRCGQSHYGSIEDALRVSSLLLPQCYLNAFGIELRSYSFTFCA